MNIFITDFDPIKAAINLDDKRCRHSYKEAIEMLACYIHAATDQWVIKFPLWGDDDRTDAHFLYNHPCCKWVRADKANMYWLWRHTLALAEEHEHRFNEVHPLKFLLDKVRPDAEIDREPIKFQNSSLYKNLDVIPAYRKTMIYKWTVTDKIKPVRWTNRDKPDWMI